MYLIEHLEAEVPYLLCTCYSTSYSEKSSISRINRLGNTLRIAVGGANHSRISYRVHLGVTSIASTCTEYGVVFRHLTPSVPMPSTDNYHHQSLTGALRPPFSADDNSVLKHPVLLKRTYEVHSSTSQPAYSTISMFLNSTTPSR